MRSKATLFVLFVVLFANLNFAQAVNFYPVTDGIYRGPRPDVHDLNELKLVGVKTIIYIDNDKENMIWERKLATALGFKFIAVPLSGFWAPSDSDVDKILGHMTDKSLYPLYLHCKLGMDRTGLLVGLYRVFYQGVDPAVAYKEMLDMGFHRSLVFLNHYYEERTGFDD